MTDDLTTDSALMLSQFGDATQIFADRVQSQHLMCDIYDAFSGPGDANHNCLGCNIDDLTDQIVRYLAVCTVQPPVFTLPQAFSVYALLLNSLWERISDVFDIVTVPRGYRERHFAILVSARRWANFFKHPKEFGWLVHHPTYTIADTPHCKEITDNGYMLVDEQVLKDFYSAERCKKGLAKKFNGRKGAKIAVILPDIVSLTEEVCNCLHKFVEVVTKNPVYLEILDDKSTIVDYFESKEEDA